MKKMMTVLAACAVTSLALADSGVVSQNIVGYQTVNVNSGFNMFSLNWVEIGTANDAIAISNLFGSAQDASLTAGANAGVSDMLQVWNGTGYEGYFYKNNAGTHYWQKVGVPGATADSVPTSAGFWFLRRASGTTNLTISAQVRAISTFGHVMENGFNAFGVSFPVTVAINDAASWDWDAAGVTAGANAGVSDMLQVWNGTGYEGYFYKNNAGTHYWQKVGVPGATTDTIPLGAGVWFMRRSTAITVTQTKTF